MNIDDQGDGVPEDKPASDEWTWMWLVVILAAGNIAQAIALWLVYHPLA